MQRTTVVPSDLMTNTLTKRDSAYIDLAVMFLQNISRKNDGELSRDLMVSMDKNKWDFQMKLGEGAACGAVGVGQVSLRILIVQNIWSTLVKTLI